MKEWFSQDRPQSLTDIIGQESAVHAMRSLMRHRRRPNLMFYGPSGNGKTTFARLYARLLLCDGPTEEAAPCERCESCDLSKNEQHPALLQFDGSRLNPNLLRDCLGHLQSVRTIAARQYVYLIDEAHGLRSDTQDIFLLECETPRVPAVFIFVSTDPNALSVALRSRCMPIKIEGPLTEHRAVLLQRAAVRRSLFISAHSIDILSRIDTSMRSSLGLLEELETLDQTSPEDIRLRLYPQLALAYRLLRDTLRGDCLDELHTLDLGNSVSDVDVTIGHLLRDACASRDAANYLAPCAGAAFASLTLDERLSLVRALLDLAEDASVPALGRGCATWDVVKPRDKSAILYKLGQLKNILACASRIRPHRARHPRRAPACSWRNGTEAKLGFRFARRIYDSATFLMQEHGICLNACFKLQFDNSELATSGARAGTVLNRLSTEMRRHARGPLHYIALFGADASEAGSVLVAAHLERRSIQWAESWLRSRIGLTLGLRETALLQYSRNASGVQDRAIRDHWSFVRRLWGCISPDVTDGGIALLDLLRVPEHFRHRPEPVARRISTSNSIGEDAYARACLAHLEPLSALADGAYIWLFNGWEAREHEDRAGDKAEQSRVLQTEIALAELDRTLSESDEHAIRQHVCQSWPQNPRVRNRSWRGWWEEVAPRAATHF